MDKPHKDSIGPRDTRVLDDVAILVLDHLADLGGVATPAALFERTKSHTYGRAAVLAGQRAGYSGRNDHESAELGKEQLFREAMDQLLETKAIVVWGEGDQFALNPRHRVSLKPGQPPYVPGTNLWTSQRTNAATALRETLRTFRDETFEKLLQNASLVYATQFEREQVSAQERQAAIAELLVLGEQLINPRRLATYLRISEEEVQRARPRHSAASPARTRGSLPRPAESGSEASSVPHDGPSLSPEGPSLPNGGPSLPRNGVTTDLQQYPKARNQHILVTIEDLAKYVRLRGACTRSKVMAAMDLTSTTTDALFSEYETHYPGCIVHDLNPDNNKPRTLVYPPDSARSSD